MSSRTSRWASQVPPGPPAPSSRAPSIGPPPTIYPESSVSNPDASRYTGRSSRARSASISHPPSRYESQYTSSSHSSPRQSTRSSRASTPTPPPVYNIPPGEPIVARRSDARGRTDYVILPAPGQTVEILHPTPIRASSASPYSSSSYYSSSSPRSPTREKPLLRRLFDKVEWNGDKNSRRSASVSHSSSRSSRSRHNSTDDDDYDWTALPDNHRRDHRSRRSVDSGSRGSVTTVTSGGRTYDIIHV